MSSEIVPALEEDDGISETTPLAADTEVSDALRCRRPLEDIRAFDLLGLLAQGYYRVNLIGGNHHIRHFVAPEKGHQSVTQFDPTPSSLKYLLYEIKEPSTLLLRGCGQLLQQSDFPFEKFKTLTTLEISGVTKLTTLPVTAISKMTQLQSLNLSHLLIETLPKGFFSGLVQLRLLNLRWCSKLRYLPSTQPLLLLEVLDLSHCTALQELEVMQVDNPKLEMLALPCTALPRTPAIGTLLNLTHLSLRDAKVIELANFKLKHQFNCLKVLDLSGAQNVKGIIHRLKIKESRLVALDLSRTDIGCINFISDMTLLRYLILRECTRLVKLPAMGKLENLEVLDLSGCETLGDLPEDLSNLRSLKELNLSGCCCLIELREGLFDEMSFLEKLDLSNTNIHHLPSFSNLTNLQTLNISHTPLEELPDLSNLTHLREFFSVDCHKLKDLPAGLQTLTNQNTLVSEIDFIEERISKPSEFHLVSTFFNKSAFDKFKQKFGEIVGLIPKIHENLKPSTLDTTGAPTTNTAISATNSETFDCTTNSSTNVVSCDISSQTFSGRFGRMLADLEYIRNNIDLLESSSNGTSAVELLNDLTGFSIFKYPPLPQLHKMVVKLKLLVPPPNQVEEKNKKRNKKEKFTKRSMHKEEDVTDSVNENDVNMNTPEMQKLSRSYHFLTDTQRNCLSYFAGFIHSTKSSNIKERILIQLWYAEGLIEQNVALSNVNSTENPHSTPNQNLIREPAAYSNPNPEIMATSTETNAKRVESPNTIQEIGRKTLMVLEEKGFIERVELSRPYFNFKHSATWRVKYHACSFMRAKAEGLYGFNDKIGKVNPHFCLLKSLHNFTNSSEKLESFKTVRTLLNLSEPKVDIRAEWLSMLRNLYVLHLGISGIHEEPIEVVDYNFLEELKNMKQLRLLNLEGFSTITKLPKSVCKVTNLKILNLRECSYLEELPAGIGSLKNLTHLDITNCHILHYLPRGLRFLSKLEVLKGFVITYQIGGRQHRDACTLRELLELEKLRKLNLVVNTEKFPNSEDVQVFKEMKNLCNLKITWEKNYNKDHEPHDVVGQKLLRHSRWKQQTRQQEIEEPSTSNPDFINLRKLVMCCFPLETAPSWLHPTGLQKLEKLYILGGKLTVTTLAGDTNKMHTWNVKDLRLRYLSSLEVMDWQELRRIFSNMKYYQGNDRGRSGIRNFPGFYGKWKENEDV